MDDPRSDQATRDEFDMNEGPPSTSEEPLDAEQACEPAPVRRRQDPVARALTIAVLVAVIAILGSIAYILYAGLLGPRAPRTAVERQLQVLERFTAENPSSPEAWADYLKALTLTEQYVKADQVLDDIGGLAESEPAIMVELGRLHIERGELEEALEVLDAAIELARDQREERLAEVSQMGITGLLGDQFAVWIADAAILKTGVYQQLDDWELAVEAATLALDENPTMADVLVIRAYANIELGDEESAIEDFRAALELIPDYEPALEGLELLGEVE